MIVRESQLTNRKNNFDFIRLLAAFLVFWDHSFQLFTGEMMDLDPVREIFGYSSGALGVQLFFCLSGFLVTRSLEKSPHVLVYLRNRCLRILPGLAGVTVLSILLLGLFFSELDFKNYLSSGETWLYLQNILIYRTYYYLPGVFEENILNASVNGSLWSIPYEFTCYLALPLLTFVKTLQKYLVPATLLLLFIVYGLFEKEINPLTVPGLGITMGSFVSPALFFLSGSVFYLWRKKISYNWRGLLVCLGLLMLIRFELIDRRFLAFFLPYLLFAFAFSDAIRLYWVGKYGDFSYGFYLYAFPVQQAVSALFREKTGFAGLFVIALLLSLFFAILSWHLIERPALSLKTKKNKAGSGE